MSVTIILADDHEIFRDGLKGLLHSQPDLKVTADVGDGQKAVEAACDRPADLVIMDVSMPGMNGVEATRRILETRPETRVLALSMHLEREFVLAVLEAGATGYLVKECALDELVLAARTVLRGEVYLSPRIASHVLEAYRNNQAEDYQSEMAGMTAREREVLQGIVEGLTTREIGEALHISEKTVGTHRQHLMKKLDIHTVVGLTKFAIRQGLTSA